MVLYIVQMYDREFGYVGANYYNTAYIKMTPSDMKRDTMKELYGYGFRYPKIHTVRMT